MIWERGSTPLRATQATAFRFRVEDAGGRPQPTWNYTWECRDTPRS